MRKPKWTFHVTAKHNLTFVLFFNGGCFPNMRTTGVLIMRHGLILGSLFGSENTFCTYPVFYLTHLTVMAVIFMYGFVSSRRIVYLNSDLHYLLLFLIWFLLIVNYETRKR
jgi:hypothetical protein